jgi:hypothetical protein
MDSKRFEVESEAWYRAIAEGRLAPGSDRYGNAPLPRPDGKAPAIQLYPRPR